MADLATLERALRNADAAGDVAAARMFAAEIRKMRAAAPEAKPAPAAPPMPPPGAIIHGATESYSTDDPRISVKREAPVNTQAMDDEITALRERMANEKGALGIASKATRETMPVAQGLGMGFSDELTSSLGAIAEPLTGGFQTEEGQNADLSGRYALLQEMQRQELERQRKEAPIRSGIGEIGGGVGGALAMGARGVQSASALPEALKRASPRAAAALSALLDGAAFGALTSSGSAKEGERLSGAAEGGAVGAFLGLASPIAGRAAKAVLDKTGITTGATKAQKLVSNALSRQLAKTGESADAVASRMAAQFPYEPKMIDLAGPEGAAIARNARDMSRDGRSVIEQFLGERMAGAKDRLMQDTLEAGGLSERRSVEGIQEGIAKRMQPRISAAYKRAGEAGFDLPREPFAALLESPTVKAAVEQAMAQTKDRAIRAGQNSGSQLDVYDAAKKILDAQVKMAIRAGNTEAAPRISGLAQALRETVDAHIPEYGGARDLAQQLAKAQKAVELGASGAKAKTGADYPRIVTAAREKNPNEVAQGFAAGMADNIAGTTSIDQALGKFSQSMDGGAALRAALGDGGSAKLQSAIDRERNNLALSRELTGGSQTTRLREEIKSASASGLPAGVAAWFAGLEPTGIGLATAASIGAAKGGRVITNKMAQGSRDRIGREIIDMMLSPAPAAVKKIQQTAGKSAKQQDAINAIAKLLGIGLIGPASAAIGTGQ